MKHKKELFCPAAMLILVVFSIVLPPSGKTALLDEACTVLIIWAAALYIIWKAAGTLKDRKISRKAGGTIAIAVCVLAGVWFSKDLAADLAGGARSIVLYEPGVSHTQGHTGIFSNHYYLTGKDAAGTAYRIEISDREYQTIPERNARKIQAIYYERTNRLLEYR